MILNNFWGKRQCDWFQDDSGLGLLMGVYLQVRTTKLLCMGTYWPVLGGKIPPGGRHLSGKLVHRVLEHMQARHRPEKEALPYIQNLVLKAATAHRARYPLAPVLLGGDLNTRLEGLEPWAGNHGWKSSVEPLIQDRDRFKTFWGFNLPSEQGWSGVSWIDHILAYSPSPITPVRVSLGQGPYWANISDHRPLTTWFTGDCLLL